MSDSCFTVRRIGDRVICVPCNELSCSHCRPRLRLKHLDQLMSYLGDKPLFKLDKPDTEGKWAYLRTKMIKAGYNAVSIPRPDGGVTVFTDQPIGEWVENPEETIWDAFMAQPPGTIAPTTRGWVMNDRFIPVQAEAGEQVVQGADDDPTYGYRVPWGEFKKICAEFDLRIMRISDQWGGRAEYRIHGLDEMSQLDRQAWAERTGEYVIRRRVKDPAPFDIFTPFVYAA